MRQVLVEVYKLPPVIDHEDLRKYLETIHTFPRYHLDFETYQEAIPPFDSCHPYEQIPFQYSLHIEYEDGHLEHREYLAKEGTDPRRAVAEHLVRDIPTDVLVLAYNMSFEKSVLIRLAGQFQDLSEHLMAVRDNIKDLMIPFQKGYFYDRAQKGSYSIKNVLPALCPNDPELDYHALSGVHNGSEASAAFATMPQHTPEEIVRIRKNLLRYCGLDTYAMVKILSVLEQYIYTG